MAKEKLLHEGEILSDNTHVKNCEQCRDCTLWGIDENDYFSNRHDKGNCAMFPHPDHKPIYVIDNQAPCPYKAPGRSKK